MSGWTWKINNKRFPTNNFRNFSNCLVSALAKSRAASRLVRTMAGDSRNMLQTWLDWSHLDKIQMVKEKRYQYQYNGTDTKQMEKALYRILLSWYMLQKNNHVYLKYVRKFVKLFVHVRGSIWGQNDEDESSWS